MRSPQTAAVWCSCAAAVATTPSVRCGCWICLTRPSGASLTLARWAETGILTREAAVYNELARHFGRIRIFTYGDDSDLAHRSAFARVTPAAR